MRCRELFLRGMAAIYLLAFASIWAQFPGLLSRDGLTPAAAHAPPGSATWRRVLRSFAEKPTLLSLLPALPSARLLSSSTSADVLSSSTSDEGIVPVDIALEACMVLGAVVAAWLTFRPGSGGVGTATSPLGVSTGTAGGAAAGAKEGLSPAAAGFYPGGVGTAAAFVALYVLYLTVFDAGGTFLSFQWDILLLEAGVVTALYALPVAQAPARVLLRFLLFKLMLMAGAVKLQSGCPTWSNLTATQYHYATQCLPPARAWWAHQQPPLLHRAAVAGTLLIELPAAWLLLAPSAAVRRAGAALQVVLQVAIIATGNYGFFNLLTALLCAPCWEEGGYFNSANFNFLTTAAAPHTATTFSRAHAHGSSASCGTSTSRGAMYRCARAVPWVLVWVAATVVTGSAAMFNFSVEAGDGPWWAHAQLTLAHTPQQYDAALERVLPPTLAYMGAWLLLSIAQAFWQARGILDKAGSLAAGAVSTILFALSAANFQSIAQSPVVQLQSRFPALVTLRITFWAWHLTSSYGLFRAMTGVGAHGEVARPELVISGTDNFHLDAESDIGGTQHQPQQQQQWREVHFKWKPTDVRERPRQVAPHQPRLDWQMWFAALGFYQHQPWLINLVNKLHHGCKNTLALLDQGRYPFTEKPPQAIMIDLYHYDFTRLNTTWAADTSMSDPNESILCSEQHTPATSNGAGTGSGIYSTSTGSAATPGNHDAAPALQCAPRDHWWHRRYARPYMPPLQKSDRHMVAFLQHHGLPTGGCVPLATDTCPSLPAAVSQGAGALAAVALCHGTAAVRNRGMVGFWGVVAVVAVVARLTVLRRRPPVTKAKTD